MKRSELLNAFIRALPEEERRAKDPVKTCRNCYNFRVAHTLLNTYWAHARCLHCCGFDNWSHVSGLLDEIKSGKIKDEMGETE